MIKVNLLKGKGTSPKISQSTAYTDDIEDLDFDGGGSDQSDSKSAIVKFLLILLVPGLLYAYEWYNLDQLDTRIKQLNAQKSNIESQISALQPEFDKAKTLKDANDELNKKITIVKDMGKLRLREIKAIDHLQSITPELVWLTSFNFKPEGFTVEGFATNDEFLEKFLEGLRNKSYFRDVILSKAIEEKVKTGLVKRFLITSTLAESD